MSLGLLALTLNAQALTTDSSLPLSHGINAPTHKQSALLEADPMAPAGILKAGMLCLPSGRARVSDFVQSESAYRRLLSDALENTGIRAETKSMPTELVILTAVDANLCARGYGAFGMGDRRSLSGRASFTFRLQWQDGQQRPPTLRTVSIERSKKEAIPADQYLALAMQEVVKER